MFHVTSEWKHTLVKPSWFLHQVWKPKQPFGKVCIRNRTNCRWYYIRNVASRLCFSDVNHGDTLTDG